jgi:acyl-CoA oxidase
VKGKNEGVNAFLVPIRDTKTHKPLPGMTIIDMGHKVGVNGVDNAALKYDRVRIPRVNMMNRFADVTPEGVFKSDVKFIPQRFFKVTERLLSGRICIAAMCIGAQKACLMIAIKYAQQRLSIGISGKSTEAIMSYQLQQNALMPLMSRSLALNVMYN